MTKHLIRRDFFTRGVTRKGHVGDKEIFVDEQSIAIIGTTACRCSPGLGGVFETCGRITVNQGKQAVSKLEK